MNAIQVTRVHLKMAAQNKHSDLLDWLLECDASGIDDNSLFTDTWGDGLSKSSFELAAHKIEMLHLLQGKKPATYERQSEPTLSEIFVEQKKVNRQGEIAKATGLLFQPEGLGDAEL